MKSHPKKLLLHLAMACCVSSAFAAKDISGPQVYTENFDSLPEAATYSNDTTVSGWYLYRPSGSYVYGSSDGTGTWAGAFYNLGAVAAPDRALGSAATGGDFQKVVIFRNTGANALKVTNISYATEVYLTNNAITNTEPTRVATRVENSEAALTDGTTLGAGGAGPGLINTGWINDTLLTYTYPAQDPASTVLAPAFSQVTSGAPTASVIVGAGQYLAIRFTDVNAGGSDAYIGLDDVSITFTELTQPEASSVRLTSSNLSYAQNFDSLGSVGGTDWINNGTIPAWFLGKRANNTTPNLLASDGSGTWAGNFYNLGVVDAPDRALGAGVVGEAFTKMVVFHNASSNSMIVSNVALNYEVYRNSSNNVAETVTFSTLVGSSEAALTSRINEATTSGGWLDDTPLSFVYPGQPTALGIETVFSEARNLAPATTITIPAGQYLALRWVNPNDSGNDGYIAIDDVDVDFETVSGSIVGEVVAGSLIRDQKGTPSDPSDDHVVFNLTVTGTNVAPSTTWTATGGTETGDYGTPVSISRPITTTGVVVVPFHDTVNPKIASSVTVTAPVNPAYISPTRTQGITFGAPGAGTTAVTRMENTVDLGWATSGAGSAVRTQPAPNNAAKYFGFSTGAVLTTFTTEPVNVSEVSNFKVQLGLAAYTTSTSGFEAQDLFDIIVESSATGDFTDAVELGKLLDSTVTNGLALFDAVKVTEFTTNPAPGNPVGMNYGNAVVPATAQTTWPTAAFGLDTYAGVYGKPAASDWVRLRIVGINDGSEHLLVDNVLFVNAVPKITPVITNVVRMDNNTQTETDDTIEFDVTVAQEVGGANGWTSNIPTTTVGTWTGAYGTPVHVFTTTATPLTLTFADADTPTLTASANIVLPRHLFFGKVKVNNVNTADVKAITAGPTIYWQNDTNNAVKHRGTGVTTFDSQAIDLTGATGNFNFTAKLVASETSGGTNFEVGDTFKIELVLTKTDTTEEIINLVLGHSGDLDANGLLNGSGTTEADEFNLGNQPVSAQAGNTFTFTKTQAVAGYTSAKIRVTGGAAGGNFDPLVGYGTNSEEFVLSELAFNLTTGFVDTDNDGMDDGWENANFGDLNQTASGDADGDGSSNITEFLAGTDPRNPADSLKITSFMMTGNEVTLSWNTVGGKNYQIEYSTGLGTWETVVTSPTIIPGTDSPATTTGTSFTNPVPTEAKVFFRAKVVP